MGVDLVADATYDRDGLAGFTGVSVAFTHRVGDRLHSAIITATKPVDADPATTVTAPASRTRLPMASADSGCC